MMTRAGGAQPGVRWEQQEEQMEADEKTTQELELIIGGRRALLELALSGGNDAAALAVLDNAIRDAFEAGARHGGQRARREAKTCS